MLSVEISGSFAVAALNLAMRRGQLAGDGSEGRPSGQRVICLGSRNTDASRYRRPQIQKERFGTPGRNRTHNLLIRRMKADFGPPRCRFESERRGSGALVSPHSECRSKSKFAGNGGEFKDLDTLTGLTLSNATVPRSEPDTRRLHPCSRFLYEFRFAGCVTSEARIVSWAVGELPPDSVKRGPLRRR